VNVCCSHALSYLSLGWVYISRLWPLPWPDDLHMQTWPIFPEDASADRQWTFWVKAFESYRCNRTTNTGWAKKPDHFWKYVTPAYDDVGMRYVTLLKMVRFFGPHCIQTDSTKNIIYHHARRFEYRKISQIGTIRIRFLWNLARVTKTDATLSHNILFNYVQVCGFVAKSDV